MRKGPRRVRGSLPPPPPPRHPRAPPPSMTFIDSEKTSRYSHLASPPNPRGTLSKHEGGEEQPSRLVTVDGAATPIDAARKRARGGVVNWPEEGLPRRRARAVVERPRGRSTLVRDEAVVRRLKYSQSSINSVAAPQQERGLTSVLERPREQIGEESLGAGRLSAASHRRHLKVIRGDARSSALEEGGAKDGGDGGRAERRFCGDRHCREERDSAAAQRASAGARCCLCREGLLEAFAAKDVPASRAAWVNEGAHAYWALLRREILLRHRLGLLHADSVRDGGSHVRQPQCTAQCTAQ